MTPDTLMEDLERRRDLAVELSRFADGSQGHGLGTALAGVLAILNPVLFTLASRPVLAYAQRQPGRPDFWGVIGPILILCIALIAMTNALLWLSLRGVVQARLYRRHGEARGITPAWEARIGLALLLLLLFAGVWIGGGAMTTLRLPLEPSHHAGSPLLRVVASMAILGTLLLLVATWKWLRGWRNWLGWTALCAPFLLFVSAPLFNELPHGGLGIVTLVLLLSFIIGFIYLPFMALYVGIRDHLRYRRLLKELAALPSLEAQP